MSGEPPTWEYRTADPLDPALDLDALGRDGWELAGTVNTDGAVTLYFKRRGAAFRERVTLDQKRAVYARFGLALPDTEGPQA